MEQVGSRVRVLNVLIENEDVGDLYTDDFFSIEPARQLRRRQKV